MRGILTACLLLCSLAAPQADEAGSPFLAAIELHTAEEFQQILQRANAALLRGELPLASESPIAFILHGPEVHLLLQENYLANKATVDLAARLSALGVVEIKACETWMGGNRIDPAQLQAFVGTVPYGLEEIRRLTDERGYVDF